jgi:hypothetical protein
VILVSIMTTSILLLNYLIHKEHHHTVNYEHNDRAFIPPSDWGSNFSHTEVFKLFCSRISDRNWNPRDNASRTHIKSTPKATL